MKKWLADRLSSALQEEQVPDKQELMKRSPLFAELDAESLTALADRMYLRRLKKDETVYEIGSAATAVYFILEGTVGLYPSSEASGRGRLHLLKAGSHFGDAALFGARERRHRAVTCEDSLLLALFRSDYELLCRMRPQAALHILSLAAQKMYAELTVIQNELQRLTLEGRPDQ